MTTTPKTRPILFKGEMVKAILDGTKTQTRRIVKPQPVVDSFWPNSNSCIEWDDIVNSTIYYVQCGHCPYGKMGDHLYVKETWLEDRIPELAPDEHGTLHYRATGDATINARWTECKKWKSAMFMPKWASRITLEITDIRVQRVQEISKEDAKAEGVTCTLDEYLELPRTVVEAYAELWDSINGKKKGCGWADNPWVWVLEFRRLTP